MGKYILPELTATVSSDHKFQVITPSKAIAYYLKVPHYSFRKLDPKHCPSSRYGLVVTLVSIFSSVNSE
ncbi:MAG: hypothetical protein RLZZ04_4042 [Cyanobacteriota bacterium]|jgi:hypothetical protein